MLRSLGIAVIKTCESIFLQARDLEETFRMFLYPLSLIIVIMCLVSKINLWLLSKYSIISLDILFFFSILFLVFYHILKEPDNLFKNSD